MQKKISINLDSLFDLSARLNETYDRRFILNSALLSLMGKLRVLRGSVYIKEKSSGKLSLFISKGSGAQNTLPELHQGECSHSGIKTLEQNTECERLLIESGFESIVPVNYRGGLLALLCLGKRFTNEKISPDEALYARLVSTIAAISLQNAENYSSLEHAKNNIERHNLLLTTLFEISSDFSSLLSKNEILKMLSYRLMGHLMVTKFSLLLFDADGNAQVIINRFQNRIETDLIDIVRNTKATAEVSRIFQADKLRKITDFGIEVISPMYVQGIVRGILLAGKKLTGERYTGEDLHFLNALGNRAIAALENERLFHQEVEKKRLDAEMTTALDIQRNLLPKEQPGISGWDIFGVSIPSRHVGGDYFDFIELSQNRLLTGIADVSGKGLPASLLMANVQAALRVLAPVADSIETLIRRINKVLYENTTPDKFVTFFCGIIDTHLNTFEYINAGHNPPYIFRETGQIEELTAGGLILGFSGDDFPYETGIETIRSGDVILLFTDGANEARSETGDELGETALKQIVMDNSHKTAEQICGEIILKVKNFSGNSSQYDDITLVTIKKL